MMSPFVWLDANAQNSKYIVAVDEYVPAPGQFINTLPSATADDTPATMATKCTERIANNAGQLVTLGAYGGYLTFHFDHPVVNVKEKMDFLINGNTFTGGSEPGIVMVSQDENGNGIPDDTWYELSGSADVDSIGKVTYGYEITYTKQGELANVPWTDNQGATGEVPRNGFHKQEYFPLWLGESLTFKGTLLPKNGRNTSTTGQNWVLSALRYGYIDNLPNDDVEGNSFNLEWAVEPVTRQHVDLTHADFIRVYTALNQVAGWLGETSTEITGAEDLHLEESVNWHTGIKEVLQANGNDDTDLNQAIWCSLDGRVLQTKPTQRGIYLRNGKKMIINQ
ncbi:MAG: hypothetical protein K5893_07560 [Prevotella sp.]|nr:hypothetical protein [Prevotella sp.]